MQDEIQEAVQKSTGTSPRRRKAPSWRDLLVTQQDRMWEQLRASGSEHRNHLSGTATYVLADTMKWIADMPPNSIHAVVTDPPYGVIEYETKDHAKLRSGRGGVWRIPPTFDGAKRQPLPRFTVLSPTEIERLCAFFGTLAGGLEKALVPGGHVIMASNPLLSTLAFHAFQQAGFEKRGEVIRLVQTLRGGDRPKNAEEEFSDVSVMARSCWEPWGIFRKPFSGTVAENLRAWGTGGLRRISDEEPFKDVITCSPTRGKERDIAPHPSLKPQRLLRKLVRASLPLGIGIVYDPFAGSGSTLAAAENLGYRALGTDRDAEYFAMAKKAFPHLSTFAIDS